MRKPMVWVNLFVAITVLFSTASFTPTAFAAASPVLDAGAYRQGVVLVGFYPEALGQPSLGGTTTAGENAVQGAQGALLASLQEQLGLGELRPLFNAPLAPRVGASSSFVNGKDLSGTAAVYELTLSGGASVEDAVAALKQNPAVAFAEPDYLAVPAATTPNDPRYSEQWGLAKVKAPQGWDVQKGSPETIIAVIDFGH